MTPSVTHCILLLFRKLAQALCRYQLDAAPRERHQSLRLEIAEHPRDHLTRRNQMRSYKLMGYTQTISSALSSRRKAARRLSKLFHIICSISHMTSEKRVAIS